jgi:hypothetical protein
MTRVTVSGPVRHRKTGYRFTLYAVTAGRHSGTTGSNIDRADAIGLMTAAHKLYA